MNHEALATRVENVSMASGILAGLSAAGAAFYEPTGWDALGIWLGITNEPLIVTSAPIFGLLATASGTVSGFTYFYAQWQKRRINNQAESGDSAPPARDDTENDSP